MTEDGKNNLEIHSAKPKLEVKQMNQITKTKSRWEISVNTPIHSHTQTSIHDGPILTVKDIDFTSETPSFLLQHSISVRVFWENSNHQDNDAFPSVELEHSSERQFARLEPPGPSNLARIGACDRQHYFTIRLPKCDNPHPFFSLTLNEVPRLETILHQEEEHELRLAIQMTNATLSAFNVRIQSMTSRRGYRSKNVFTDLSSPNPQISRAIGDHAICHFARADENEGNIDLDLRCIISGLAVGEETVYVIRLSNTDYGSFEFNSNFFVLYRGAP
ncbi:hypothetical protein CAPTEDRAFT_194780 [Capitella teleta]|uniref:Uncharacterized protein n=1 Tax=Capitella teleta TaxID=283909 RepID=R7TZX3_CAPTE|nr:hypothetical protein CAPTEDRAFT_194780 [Capitella teleta]|eukprot:ELT96951.1 hypothetical protein CAPTEDRAFT_194780 [Capitella teleta]